MVSIGGEEYYTAEEACQILGVKLATIYSYVNRGLLTSYRQGIRRQRLYRRSDVQGLLEVTPVLRADGDSALDLDIPRAETWAGEL